jgi:hypothetical protein
MTISVTNKQYGVRWYECERCGIETPETSCIVQNGLIVCYGPNTRNCRDNPGHAANMKQLDVPHEEAPHPLPQESIDL